MKHTETPWLISKPKIRRPQDQENDRLIHTKDGRHIAETFQYQNHDNKNGPSIANAQRIVACVNACENINPEAVPDMLEALKDIVGTLDQTSDVNLVNDSWRKAKQALVRATGKD